MPACWSPDLLPVFDHAFDSRFGFVCLALFNKTLICTGIHLNPPLCDSVHDKTMYSYLNHIKSSVWKYFQYLKNFKLKKVVSLTGFTTFTKGKEIQPLITELVPSLNHILYIYIKIWWFLGKENCLYYNYTIINNYTMEKKSRLNKSIVISSSLHDVTIDLFNLLFPTPHSIIIFIYYKNECIY